MDPSVRHNINRIITLLGGDYTVPFQEGDLFLIQDLIHDLILILPHNLSEQIHHLYITPGIHPLLDPSYRESFVSLLSQFLDVHEETDETEEKGKLTEAERGETLDPLKLQEILDRHERDKTLVSESLERQFKLIRSRTDKHNSNVIRGRIEAAIPKEIDPKYVNEFADALVADAAFQEAHQEPKGRVSGQFGAKNFSEPQVFEQIEQAVGKEALLDLHQEARSLSKTGEKGGASIALTVVAAPLLITESVNEKTTPSGAQAKIINRRIRRTIADNIQTFAIQNRDAFGEDGTQQLSQGQSNAFRRIIEKEVKKLGASDEEVNRWSKRFQNIDISIFKNFDPTNPDTHQELVEIIAPKETSNLTRLLSQESSLQNRLADSEESLSSAQKHELESQLATIQENLDSSFTRFGHQQDLAIQKSYTPPAGTAVHRELRKAAPTTTLRKSQAPQFLPFRTGFGSTVRQRFVQAARSESLGASLSRFPRFLGALGRGSQSGIPALSNSLGLARGGAGALRGLATAVGTAGTQWWVWAIIGVIIVFLVILFAFFGVDFTAFSPPPIEGERITGRPDAQLASGTCPVPESDGPIILLGVYQGVKPQEHGTDNYFDNIVRTSHFPFPDAGLQAGGCSDAETCPPDKLATYGLAIDVQNSSLSAGDIVVPYLFSSGGIAEDDEMIWTVYKTRSSSHGFGIYLEADGNGHSWQLLILHMAQDIPVGTTFTARSPVGGGSSDQLGTMFSWLGNNHIHFEVLMDGVPIDPTPFCDGSNVGIAGFGKLPALRPDNLGHCTLERIARFFPEFEVSNALCICQEESGGNTNAENRGCFQGITNEHSIGLFQVNLLVHDPPGIGCHATSRGGQGYIWSGTPHCTINNQSVVDECMDFLFDPDKNAQYAARLQNSQGWGPWSTRKNCGL